MSGRHRDDIPGETPGGGGYDPGAHPNFGPQDTENGVDWFAPREGQGGPIRPGGEAGRAEDAGGPQWFAQREPAPPGSPARPPAAPGGAGASGSYDSYGSRDTGGYDASGQSGASRSGGFIVSEPAMGAGRGPGGPGAGAPGPGAGNGGFSGASDAGGYGLGRSAGTSSSSYAGSGPSYPRTPGDRAPGDRPPGDRAPRGQRPGGPPPGGASGRPGSPGSGAYAAGAASGVGAAGAARGGGRPTASSGPYESLSSSSDTYDSLPSRSGGGGSYDSGDRGRYGGSGGSGDSGGYGGSGGSGGSGGYGSGEYNGGRRKSRRSATALIGPLAGAVGLALLLGVGVYAFAQGGSCSDDNGISLNVTTAPDIAPAVTAAVSRFNDQKRKVGDQCVQATVTSADPAAVTTLLSGQGVSSGASKRPDVWIPDTSLWLDVISSSTKGKVKLTATKTSVAQSPLVVAMPRTLAAKLKSQGVITNPSWDNLLTAVGGTIGGAVTKNQIIPAGLIKLTVTDPTRHGAGMTGLVIAQMLVNNDPNARSIFTGIVRTMRESTTPDVKTQLAAFKPQNAGKFPVALVPEQAVWKHNSGNPAEPAVAIYPTEGTLNLDHPFTITAESKEKAEAAGLLEQALNTDTARNDIRGLGFRTADGKAPSTFGAKTGVNPQRPRQLPAPKAESVESVIQAWSKLSLGIRLLSLLDVSGSMAEKVPGTNVTRMQATAKIAQGGLSLMPDDTELGQWSFSTKMVGKQDWREEVPIGPLGERIGSSTRRQAVLSSLAGLQPIPTGDTGLYDSLLAAFRNMRKTYKPEMINTILLLTDGKNDDDDGITLKVLLSTLKKEYDPSRPVQVMMIGFGAGVDRNELDQIAKVTRGSVAVANRPEDIQKIFLQAISRRVCAPTC